MHLNSSVVFFDSLQGGQHMALVLVSAVFLARLYYLPYCIPHQMYNVTYPVDIIILQTGTCV